MGHGGARRRDIAATYWHRPRVATAAGRTAVSVLQAPIDGSEVIVAAKRCVMIGVGERTVHAAAKRLARLLFVRGDAREALAVQPPETLTSPGVELGRGPRTTTEPSTSPSPCSGRLPRPRSRQNHR
ncbi:MAG: arginine deiminase family protein [Acidimicrobiales bacterium]